MPDVQYNPGAGLAFLNAGAGKIGNFQSQQLFWNFPIYYSWLWLCWQLWCQTQGSTASFPERSTCLENQATANFFMNFLSVTDNVKYAICTVFAMLLNMYCRPLMEYHNPWALGSVRNNFSAQWIFSIIFCQDILAPAFYWSIRFLVNGSKKFRL